MKENNPIQKSIILLKSKANKTRKRKQMLKRDKE
jgi:hypothetical protein